MKLNIEIISRLLVSISWLRMVNAVEESFKRQVQFIDYILGKFKMQHCTNEIRSIIPNQSIHILLEGFKITYQLKSFIITRST